MGYITNEAIVHTGLEIAVVGMAGKFPGANDIQEFWDVLVNNRTTISRFEASEIKDPLFKGDLVNDPAYVKARGILEDIERFDAALFGYTPHEAKLLDPQIRIFHECAWEALEDAGYPSLRYEGKIGVFAGAHTNALWEISGMLSHNDMDYANKDFLATRLCYKLDLRGPSQTIYTACSTSLVTVHMACRSLLNGECDMAIAGGVSIDLPQHRGYQYNDGNILSSSGYNKSFDAAADGTVFSNGAGVVVLKLLEDAIRDNDNIHAVVKGSAINNDGNWKVSFTAPSVKGQVDVIQSALQFSGVEPEDIFCIEAHGSATAVGDPIEVEALKQAFATSRQQFCGIGSVKSNIGHTNAAAGIAGFLKGVLSLKHRLIPATVNYESPNPRLQLEDSPFFVVKENISLENITTPVRIGVTSLGVGGTNAHVILEEPPVWLPEATARRYQLFAFSAKSEMSLNRSLETFRHFMLSDQATMRADMAFSQNTGRFGFSLRGALISDDAVILEDIPHEIRRSFRTVMIFPDEQFYFDGLISDLYKHEVGFQLILQHCFEACTATTGIPVQKIFENGTEITEGGHSQHLQSLLACCVQYAMAKYTSSLGIVVDHMLGYSTGRLVMDCINGQHGPEMMFTSLSDGKELFTSGKLDGIFENPDVLLLTVGHSEKLLEEIYKHPRYDHDHHIVIHLLPAETATDSSDLYFTRQLGRLWTYGMDIDWKAYYSAERRRKVSLPAYSFDKVHYWIDEVDFADLQSRTRSSVIGENTPAEWLYYPFWRQQPASPRIQPVREMAKTWLLFVEASAVAVSLKEILEVDGQQVILVYPGDTYREDTNEFIIRPQERSDYLHMMKRLSEDGRFPAEIIHCWNVTPDRKQEGIEAFRAAQHIGFYSVINLAQCFSEMGILSPLSITIVTMNLHPITGTETIAVEQATLLGLLQVLPQENSQFKLRNLDFETNGLLQPTAIARSIIDEIVLGEGSKIIAFRNRKRWVEHYQQHTHVTGQLPGSVSLYKEGAVYMILGGAGNIGLHIALMLARRVKATIILTSRTGSLDGWTADKLSLLREIEQLGCQVLLRRADMGEMLEMQQLWKDVFEEFGKIDCVIHAAGVLNKSESVDTVEMINRDVAEIQFVSKAYGLYMLNDLFRQYPAPEHCLLMSSLSAVLGGIGFAAYSAANVFMDYYARWQNMTGDTRWLSVNWDSWDFRTALERQDNTLQIPKFVMEPDDALAAFDMALAITGVDQVIVSVGDLHERIRRSVTLETQVTTGEIQHESMSGEKDYAAMITRLLEQHIGHKGIQPDDDFFSLGADSFILLAFINDLKKHSHKQITVKECYEHASVASLTALLQSKDEFLTPVIPPAGWQAYYNLSPAQERMYYLYALEPESTAYNEVKIFEVNPQIEKGRLFAALEVLISRHESLRTYFTAVGEETVQVIQENAIVPLEEHTLRTGDIMDFANSFVRPFDLAEAPLFRMALVRTEAGRAYLLADFHHIICDAISMDIIRRELLSAYYGHSLAAISLQYKDIAVYYGSEVFLAGYKKQQSYWLHALRNCPLPVTIPPDYNKAVVLTSQAAAEVAIMGSDLERIRTLIGEERSSLFSFLVAVFSTISARYAGVADITVGIPVSGRMDPACGNTVGMFINMLPLRTYPSSELRFQQYLQQVSTANADMLQHQDYPYNDLVRDIKQNTGIASPIFALVFNFINHHGEEGEDTNGLFIGEVDYSTNRPVKYPFIFNVRETKDKVFIGINYSPQQYLHSTIDSFLRNYLEMIEAVILNREVHLCEIPLSNRNEPVMISKEDDDDQAFYFGA